MARTDGHGGDGSGDDMSVSSADDDSDVVFVSESRPPAAVDDLLACEAATRAAASRERRGRERVGQRLGTPRAANSHSASVGNRPPAHSQKATASVHETCTTG